MNNEEIQALMSQLKNAGLSEEDIANGVLWPLFRDGKMSKEDLSTLCASIGLELDEEFENDKGPEGGEGEAANITKEEAEAAKEIKPGETKEEFEEKVEDMAKPGESNEVKEESSEEGSKEEDEDKGESEDEEWEEAKKLFKLQSKNIKATKENA